MATVRMKRLDGMDLEAERQAKELSDAKQRREEWEKGVVATHKGMTARELCERLADAFDREDAFESDAKLTALSHRLGFL